MAVLLGRTTAGTTADFSSNGGTAAWEFTAIASGSLAVIKAQTKVANTASVIRFGIYTDAGSAPGTLMAVADADTLATANGTGVAQATLSVPQTIVSGTQYWLAWYASGDNRNFQGDSGGSYLEFGGNFPGTWVGGSPSSVNAIIWGEDSGAGGGTAAKLLAAQGVG